MAEQTFQDFSQLFAVGSPQTLYKACDFYGAEIKFSLSEIRRDKGREFLQRIVDTPPGLRQSIDPQSGLIQCIAKDDQESTGIPYSRAEISEHLAASANIRSIGKMDSTSKRSMFNSPVQLEELDKIAKDLLLPLGTGLVPMDDIDTEHLWDDLEAFIGPYDKEAVTADTSAAVTGEDKPLVSLEQKEPQAAATVVPTAEESIAVQHEKSSTAPAFNTYRDPSLEQPEDMMEIDDQEAKEKQVKLVITIIDENGQTSQQMNSSSATGFFISVKPKESPTSSSNIQLRPAILQYEQLPDLKKDAEGPGSHSSNCWGCLLNAPTVNIAATKPNGQVVPVISNTPGASITSYVPCHIVSLQEPVNEVSEDIMSGIAKLSVRSRRSSRRRSRRRPY